MNLVDRKIDLTFRLYVDPADQDYVAARSAFNNGLFYVFYWCAAQACEKYLKAALLLQNSSAQDYQHDLTNLFQAVRSFDRDHCIPDLFQLPETTAMGRVNWHQKPLSLFVDYLETYGSPDNRYAFKGTNVNGPILHALDYLLCNIRSFIRRTNLTGGDLFEHQSAGLGIDERIVDVQSWMIDPLLLLERLVMGRLQIGETEALRTDLRNMNYSFSNVRTSSEKGFGGQHFHGSPLYNHLVRLTSIDDSPRNRQVVSELREWVSQKIHMSRVVRQQLGLSQ